MFVYVSMNINVPNKSTIPTSGHVSSVSMAQKNIPSKGEITSKL